MNESCSTGSVCIGDRRIGPMHPCFVIAEAGVNHNGDLSLARELIDAAAEAGADAVKFQTFSAERLVTEDAQQAEYQVRNTGKEEGQYAMLKRLELSKAAHHELISHWAKRGIQFLSTPFDEESADFLDELDVAAFKISSGDLTCHSLLEHVAAKGRPVILSTGMANIEEVDAAVECNRRAASAPLAMMHCVSCYPAPSSQCNLRVMRVMAERFNLPVGFSDHTEGSAVAFAAAALGASIMEKHITLDRQMSGPDHAASIEPSEFKEYVRGIRAVESAIGDGVKRAQASEFNARDTARKSLVAAVVCEAGDVLTADRVVCCGPGTGLSPARLRSLIGRRFLKPVRAGDLIAPEGIG